MIYGYIRVSTDTTIPIAIQLAMGNLVTVSLVVCILHNSESTLRIPVASFPFGEEC